MASSATNQAPSPNPVRDGSGALGRERRLASASGTGQGYEAAHRHAIGEFGELGIPTDEACQARRQVGRRDGVGNLELVETLGSRDAAEPVLAEIHQLDIRREG
jgi:hypothetical protein